MRVLRSASVVSQPLQQLDIFETLHGHGRALQQGGTGQAPDLASSGGVTIIAVLGGCLAATVFVGVVCMFLRRRCSAQQRVAPDVEAGAGADGAAKEEDAKPKAMDRARSAYLIEGPDGDFACGVRISSFMLRQRTLSLELPATLPGSGKDTAQPTSDEVRPPESNQAAAASAPDELTAAPSAAGAARQLSASASDASACSSSVSCDTAVEVLGRASSGDPAELDTAAQHVGISEQAQHSLGQQQPASSEQPSPETTTTADGENAAQQPESSSAERLSLRQRFSIGWFRPLPPSLPQQEADPQRI